MATSSNGWSVISSSQLDKSPFPGTGIVPVPGIRTGDVAVVLHWVGSQFNARVEGLVNPGCWGYANRPIAGSTVTSNHASGTAIDLNAPRHPQGKRGTFNSAQVAQIRSILAFCEGVIRWGGDYTRVVDEMHFEINSSSANVTRIANKIRGGSTTPPPSGTKVVMDTQAGFEAYRTVYHREPESESAAAQWNGQPPRDAYIHQRNNPEWKAIDAQVKNYGNLVAQLEQAKADSNGKIPKAAYDAIIADFEKANAKIKALEEAAANKPPEIPRPPETPAKINPFLSLFNLIFRRKK